mgnify:CR=1 FL=1
MGNEITFSLGHKVDISFMPVEPGTFVMGDEEEFNEYGWADKPKHEVMISKRFWLGEFPVTRTQWQYVMGYKHTSTRAVTIVRLKTLLEMRRKLSAKN